MHLERPHDSTTLLNAACAHLSRLLLPQQQQPEPGSAQQQLQPGSALGLQQINPRKKSKRQRGRAFLSAAQAVLGAAHLLSLRPDVLHALQQQPLLGPLLLRQALVYLPYLRPPELRVVVPALVLLRATDRTNEPQLLHACVRTGLADAGQSDPLALQQLTSHVLASHSGHSSSAEFVLRVLDRRQQREYLSPSTRPGLPHPDPATGWALLHLVQCLISERRPVPDALLRLVLLLAKPTSPAQVCVRACACGGGGRGV